MAGHTHGASSGRLLWISLGLTISFVAIEFFYGLRAHSLALLSDSGHNASDALALGLAAYALSVARRPASPDKTYGYHRAAILAALANATALGMIAAAILYEAWRAFHDPAAVNSRIIMGVAAVALVMNTVIASLLRGESHDSLNARAAYIHMAGDALSALGVLIAGVVIHSTGWTLADPLVSVLIAGFILYSSWTIIGEAVNILLEGTPKDMDIKAVVAAIRSVGRVRDVHDLHVWTVTDGMHFLSCHVVLPDDTTMAETSEVIAAINVALHDRFSIGHATIQPETVSDAGCQFDSDDLYCVLHSHGARCHHESAVARPLAH